MDRDWNSNQPRVLRDKITVEDIEKELEWSDPVPYSNQAKFRDQDPKMPTYMYVHWLTHMREGDIALVVEPEMLPLLISHKDMDRGIKRMFRPPSLEEFNQEITRSCWVKRSSLAPVSKERREVDQEFDQLQKHPEFIHIINSAGLLAKYAEDPCMNSGPIVTMGHYAIYACCRRAIDCGPAKMNPEKLKAYHARLFPSCKDGKVAAQPTGNEDITEVPLKLLAQMVNSLNRNIVFIDGNVNMSKLRAFLRNFAESDPFGRKVDVQVSSPEDKSESADNPAVMQVTKQFGVAKLVRGGTELPVTMTGQSQAKPSSDKSGQSGGLPVFEH